MTSCGKCGATWTGHKIEHCTACHQTFAATPAGDAHRVGDHAAEIGSATGRRCLGPVELAARGLWSTFNPHGVEIWHGRSSKKGVARRRTEPVEP
jgi:hypothetical protein